MTDPRDEVSIESLFNVYDWNAEMQRQASRNPKFANDAMRYGTNMHNLAVYIDQRRAKEEANDLS